MHLVAVICYCRAAKDDKSGEDAEKTISYCTKAIELNPKYVDLYVSRGSYNGLIGKFDEAIQTSIKQSILIRKMRCIFESRI